jgi:hypothetical protein
MIHHIARTIFAPLCLTLALGIFAVSFPSFAHAQATGTSNTGIQLIEGILNELINGVSGTTTSVVSGFSRDGVFGCTGASYGSVGMQGPGGSHVPVFDDAVHDQERLLTYKECLLDGVVNSNRKTLISFIIQSIVRWTNEGFEGSSAFVENLPLHMLERILDPEAERILTTETGALAEPFRRDVTVALAKDYAQTTRRPSDVLRCDVPDAQLGAFLNGDFYGGGGWNSFLKLTTNSSCNPLFAFYNAQSRMNEALSAEQARETTQLEWGSGFRSVERDRTFDIGGGQTTSVDRIVTPGFMIAEHLRQVIGTGLRQSENADEIDEMLSALMSNIGTEMLTDTEGLSGLSRSFGGQAAYVDRVVADSVSTTRSTMAGAAQQIVDNTIRVEQEYIQARQSSITVLAQTQAQLESWENTCWASIIDAARAGLAAEVETRVCQAQGSTSTTCGISVSVSETTNAEALLVSVVPPSQIRVAGKATRGDSTVTVTVVGGGQSTPVPPLSPTIMTSGSWETTPIELTDMPDGTLTVTAVEVEQSGSTHPPITATIQKETTVTGVVITPPTTRPSVTITASAGGVSESVTISPNTERSRAIVNSQIKPLLTLIRDNVYRAAKALELLTQLKQALASTTSASAQRYLLEQIDKLVAARALHTEAQLRQAQSQAGEIDAAMQQLLEETKENWEATWCDPDNWRQYVS